MQGKRDGPPASPRYFEKALERAANPQQMPLPQIVPPHVPRPPASQLQQAEREICNEIGSDVLERLLRTNEASYYDLLERWPNVSTNELHRLRTGEAVPLSKEVSS